MRQPLTAETLQAFIRALAVKAKTSTRVYLVGGASAVLLGWRSSTIDIDLKIIPESDEILRALPRLKEDLHINIELASPDDFIPALPGWQERSTFIQQEGKLSVYHYDFYAQALAKIVRGHEIDQSDVKQFLEKGLVEPKRLRQLFSAIEDQIYRYPELSPDAFRNELERVLRNYDGDDSE